MPDDVLIVPVASPNGAVHFATVNSDATIQDVLDTLILTPAATSDVLHGLEEYGWALQRIRREHPGRQWEEADLEALGNGIMPPSEQVAPLLNAPAPTARSDKTFSAFPLTSHLHTPILRLVSLHPFLSMTCSFLRVPEIHDDFQWKLFISRTSDVGDAIDSIIDELGLARSLPTPGGGNVDYVLEEVWSVGGSEKSSRLPNSASLSNILESPFSTNPIGPSATRTFRFCVPDEWYRRSRSRTISSSSLTPSEATIRRLADLEEEEEEDSEVVDGTARQKDLVQPQERETISPQATGTAADWRGSVSASRLSSLLEGWVYSTPSGTGSISQRKPVSEPKLIDRRNSIIIAGPADMTTTDGGAADDVDAAVFEEFLDELGLKGPNRDAMYHLPPEKKRYLLETGAATMSKATAARSASKVVAAQASTYSPATTASLLPRLVPQLTGDSGIMKRFSIAGWGSGSGSDGGNTPKRSSTEHSDRRSSTEATGLCADELEAQPIQPQSTGSLWSSWWTSAGGEKASSDVKGQSKESGKTATWYVDGIRNKRSTDTKLVKHLISLRVHLSTANLAWIEDFVSEQRGMDVLGRVLEGLVSKGGKRKKLNEVEETVLLESVKCFRVLLNTEPGFRYILSAPALTTNIAYSLHGSSIRLRTLSSEILAAICVLSPTEGHRAILSALSDYRVEYGEAFRFQELIASLRVASMSDDGTTDESTYRNDEEGVWEARAASMALINALTTCPDSLEERILLREEFGRRGLNEAIVALRYVKPPESLITQLDVYTEEKFEDEEDMRERARNIVHATGPRSEIDDEFDNFLHAAKHHAELGPVVSRTLKSWCMLLGRGISIELKTDLTVILERFVERLHILGNLDDEWELFLKQFLLSVQTLTGRPLEIEVASADVTEIEEELESLRSQVELLNQERTRLRDTIDEQAAEVATLKALTPQMPPSGSRQAGRGEPISGVVQRLVQKEKQVLQLQAEVDRLKAENPTEDREAEERARRERDRVKWTTLMEEITNLRAQNGELEAAMTTKNKEAVYLKRALESVYSRFRLREESREESEVDAELIANRAIDSLTQKEEEIFGLQAEIEKLKFQLAEKPKFISEKDYKHQVAPPPPPPAKPMRSTDTPVNDRNTDLGRTVSPLPPPPPPPPPPLPSLHTSSTDVVISLHPSDPSVPAGAGAEVMAAMDIPPPPLPPSVQRNKFAPSKPLKRLKPFFWNKLSPTTIASTVWSDVSTDTTFDLEDLESTFSIDTSKSTDSQLSVTSPKKASVTTLLDITRANNVAIMLSRIKLSLPGIRSALLQLDDEILSVDDLRAISKQLPTSEEITRLKDYGDVGKLAKADQYFSEIMTIPRLSERLECMLYRRRLELEIEEIRPELNIVRSASVELRSSPKFKRVLQVISSAILRLWSLIDLQAILTIGNALNGTTFRGGARGFQLDALLKLRETKTAKGGVECPTLLHYLAKLLLRSDSSLVMYIEDMPHLEAAARVSPQTLIGCVQSLVAGLKQVRDEIQEVHRLHPSPEDRFVSVMQPFVSRVSSSVEALQNMAASLDRELRYMLQFYGENPDIPEAPKPEDFFGLVQTFSLALQKAALEVHDSASGHEAKIQVSKETSTSLSEATTIKQGNDPSRANLQVPPSSWSRAGDPSVGRGDFDDVIRGLRTGKRRARVQNRPLSKIFIDGNRASRAFD
ncbi:hypothetical protein CERSUDRAFT_102967 [Gelatoporia subvermispora B]|uniref:FH2 domain-containing protein n=1 Tax=Ceriporiopsis subvermispora (strain B) TaxID=914234 RepID=M2PUY9_CERS8|nr:hypothetical protein CERSUDRAFT_102967 [Gelatoporia subvermispora B]